MSEGLYGVIQGVEYKNIEADNTINTRLYERNIPSKPLPPVFSMRGVATKQAMMPIFDERSASRVPIDAYPTFSTSEVFYPGEMEAPWIGYSNHINDESELRSQYFALQRSDQAVYVPSSNSDLYNANIQGGNCTEHPLLFKQVQFDNDPTIKPTGGMHNHTRQQLKDGNIN